MKSFPQKTLALIFVFTTAAIFSGCASQKVNQDIDTRLKDIPDIGSFQDLAKSARKEIKDSDLSADKKARLLQIQRTTEDRSNELRQQSFKLRALLIQDLSSNHYDQDEVDAIKVRLKKIQDQRLQLIYTAVDQTSSVLGTDQADQKARIIRTFDFEGHGSDE